MSTVAELLCSRRVPQVAVLALISFGFAGCSADMSSRFSQDPLSNPFASQEATGSVPTPRVERRDLPQYYHPQSAYQTSALPPVVAAPQSYPAYGQGVSGGGRGVASYTPPSAPAPPAYVPPTRYSQAAYSPRAYAPPQRPKVEPRLEARVETTGTVPARSLASEHPVGGTRIIVGTSDTLEILAHRYHVTTAAILAANGYRGPRALSPGQSLIIPRPAMTSAAAEPERRAVAGAPSSIHVVNPGETLASIARHNHISIGELARANRLDPTTRLRLGTRLTVPTRTAGAMAAPEVAAARLAAPAPATRVAAAVPQQTARLAQSSPAADEAPEGGLVKTNEATGALPNFRWPARGKVIMAYGAKTNGKINEGINLAVPEGTPVKAAGDGVVAYAGNELKGYGNLILIRHANGYVTAYAHASELLVKRGDTIKRGQVIAKSGQSGEVSSPQLHFEIRKGSTPVDPLRFLSGA